MTTRPASKVHPRDRQKAAIRSLDGIVTSQLGGDREGYVVRLAGSFHYRAFRQPVAKHVRKNHVQTDDPWALRKGVPNKLRDTVMPKRPKPTARAEADREARRQPPTPDRMRHAEARPQRAGRRWSAGGLTIFYEQEDLRPITTLVEKA